MITRSSISSEQPYLRRCRSHQVDLRALEWKTHPLGSVEKPSAPVIASLGRASRARRGDLKLCGGNTYEIAALRRPA
jgi:hypothetical protein